MSEAARSRDSGAVGIERWSLPEVAGPIIGRERDAAKDAKELEQRARATLETAQARGYEAGLAAARSETRAYIATLEERIRRLDSVLNLLAAPLRELDAEIERQLSQLALAVGKQLARRELKVDPAQVIAVIRESVSRLPAQARDVRVHLHPDDAAVVRERLAVAGTDRAWSIVEDPTLSCGGCLVRTDTAQIDSRLESRINTIVSTVLGDERAQPRGDADVAAVENL